MRPQHVLAALLCASALSAHATLLNDSVAVTGRYGTPSSADGIYGTYTVPGSGAGIYGAVGFTIDPTQITFTDFDDFRFTNAAFDGYAFTDITRDPGITDVVVDPLSTYTAGTVSFTSQSVLINLASTTIHSGEELIMDLSFDPSVAAVAPEPSSFLLLGTGLLGIAGMARRRFA